VGVSRFTLDRHLACGYFAADLAADFAPAQRHVILNAVAPSFAAVVRDQRAARPLRLGYVGQLVPAKGVRELVAQMRAWTPAQCELRVAGTGARAFEDLLRSEAPPNVKLLGFVDPRQLYESIDVLVVPSLWEEPFGMIVIEAYMQGVPVIAARRGGLPEIVDDGVTGRLYDPTRPQALFEAIDGFVRDRERLDEMRERVLARAPAFAASRMQRQYAALLADVAAARAGHWGGERVSAG
jgi:glycosyltransferase involved in cell wall biosynthesis